MLTLKKPIIFFDLETTGLSLTTDRIVEISVIKVLPGGDEQHLTYRFNPEMHIPEEATKTHHITDEDVKDKPTFKQMARNLAKLFAGCDIAGFNSNRFDIPMLDQEFQRADVDFDFSKACFIDVQTIFHKKEPRNLSAAYRFYCDKDLENAHSATADIQATYEVFLAQLERYDDLPNEIEKLAEYVNQHHNVDFVGRLIYDDKNREVINFGRYKGKIAEEVLAADPNYYDWVMKGDFTKNTKDCFTRIRLRLNK